MKHIRKWTYLIVGVFSLYLTWQVISNTPVESFDFGFVDFSREEVGNYGTLIGALVGLLGVVLLVETLWLQYSEIQRATKQREEDQKLDSYYKLSLLQIDLESILKDIKQKAEKIKEYYEAEKKKPFGGNVLYQSPLSNYSRTLELDRLSIYKGFTYFLNHRENWLKDFNSLFSILDFLPLSFKNIYERYESHVQDMFLRKSEIQKSLQKLMNKSVNLIDEIRGIESKDKLDIEIEKVTNSFIGKYYETLQKDMDEEGNAIAESDFLAISEVLHSFIEYSLTVGERDQLKFNNYLRPIITQCSNNRKAIYIVNTYSEQFADSLEDQFKLLMVDSPEKKSFWSRINDLSEMLKSELKNIEIESLN